MTITSITPYIIFNGDAAEAIRLYERALGAKVETVAYYRDLPGMKPAPENMERVSHARLEIGGGVLMMSDSMPGMFAPNQSNISVTLECDDLDDMTRKFEALAVGGKTTYPIHDAYWGQKFGMLTDAVGVQWLFSCAAK